MNRFLFVLLCVGTTLPAQSAGTLEQKEFFENNVRPVLAQACYACHTSSQMGGLRLDSRETLMKGGKSGPAVIPGEPDKSAVVISIHHTDASKRMPSGGPELKDFEIANIVKWVQDRAYWLEETLSLPRQRACSLRRTYAL